METMFFLSGLPRSGSTVLSAILNQNPDVYCSKTSPICDLMYFFETGFKEVSKQYTFNQEQKNNTYLSVFDGFYKHIPKKFVVDKHRGWVLNIHNLLEIGIHNPKVLCTVRNIDDIKKSFAKLGMKHEDIEMNVSDGIDQLNYGIQRFPNNIHLVEYEKFVRSPQEELNKIYDFLELPRFTHNFDNIDGEVVAEDDSLWGIDGLHKIKPRIETAMSEFDDNGYEIVRNALSKETCEILSNDFEIFAEVSSILSPGSEFGDHQVKKSFSKFAHTSFEAVLKYLLPVVEKVTNKRLYPTYTYARIYYNGAEMKRHTDRPSCQYSATLTLKVDNNTPWEIWFKDLHGEEKPLTLNVGDICVYKGDELEHWRNPYSGENQIQVFLHYVDVDGEYANLKYDERPCLGFPSK